MILCQTACFHPTGEASKIWGAAAFGQVPVTTGKWSLGAERLWGSWIPRKILSLGRSEVQNLSDILQLKAKEGSEFMARMWLIMFANVLECRLNVH